MKRLRAFVRLTDGSVVRFEFEHQDFFVAEWFLFYQPKVKHLLHLVRCV